MSSANHYELKKMDTIMRQQGSREYNQLLEHIAVCNRCSEIFSQYIEQSCLYRMPLNLKQSMKSEITWKQKQRQSSSVDRRNHTTSGKLIFLQDIVQNRQSQMKSTKNPKMIKKELMIYSTKVIVAAGVAIMVMFGLDLSSMVGRARQQASEQTQQRVEREKKESISDSLNRSLTDFSDFLGGCIKFGK